jgi:hypothetical protein
MFFARQELYHRRPRDGLTLFLRCNHKSYLSKMVGRLPILMHAGATGGAQDGVRHLKLYKDMKQTKVQIEYNIMGEPSIGNIFLLPPNSSPSDPSKPFIRLCRLMNAISGDAESTGVHQEERSTRSNLYVDLTSLVQSLQEDACQTLLKSPLVAGDSQDRPGHNQTMSINRMIDAYLLRLYGTIATSRRRKEEMLQLIQSSTKASPLLCTIRRFVTADADDDSTVEQMYSEMLLWLHHHNAIYQRINGYTARRLVARNQLCLCIESVLNFEGRKIPPHWIPTIHDILNGLGKEAPPEFRNIFRSEGALPANLVNLDEALEKIFEFIESEVCAAKKTGDALFRMQPRIKIMTPTPLINSSHRAPRQQELQIADHAILSLRYLTEEFIYADTTRNATVDAGDFCNICRGTRSGLWSAWDADNDSSKSSERALQSVLQGRDTVDGTSYLDFLLSLHSQISEETQIKSFEEAVKWFADRHSYFDRTNVLMFVHYITSTQVLLEGSNFSPKALASSSKCTPVQGQENTANNSSSYLSEALSRSPEVENAMNEKAILCQIDMSSMLNLSEAASPNPGIRETLRNNNIGKQVAAPRRDTTVGKDSRPADPRKQPPSQLKHERRLEVGIGKVLLTTDSRSEQPQSHAQKPDSSSDAVYARQIRAHSSSMTTSLTTHNAAASLEARSGRPPPLSFSYRSTPEVVTASGATGFLEHSIIKSSQSAAPVLLGSNVMARRASHNNQSSEALLPELSSQLVLSGEQPHISLNNLDDHLVRKQPACHAIQTGYITDNTTQKPNNLRQKSAKTGNGTDTFAKSIASTSMAEIVLAQRSTKHKSTRRDHLQPPNFPNPCLNHQVSNKNISDSFFKEKNSRALADFQVCSEPNSANALDCPDPEIQASHCATTSNRSAALLNGDTNTDDFSNRGDRKDFHAITKTINQSTHAPNGQRHNPEGFITEELSPATSTPKQIQTDARPVVALSNPRSDQGLSPLQNAGRPSVKAQRPNGQKCHSFSGGSDFGEYLAAALQVDCGSHDSAHRLSAEHATGEGNILNGSSPDSLLPNLRSNAAEKSPSTRSETTEAGETPTGPTDKNTCIASLPSRSLLNTAAAIQGVRARKLPVPLAINVCKNIRPSPNHAPTRNQSYTTSPSKLEECQDKGHGIWNGLQRRVPLADDCNFHDSVRRRQTAESSATGHDKLLVKSNLRDTFLSQLSPSNSHSSCLGSGVAVENDMSTQGATRRSQNTLDESSFSIQHSRADPNSADATSVTFFITQQEMSPLLASDFLVNTAAEGKSSCNNFQHITSDHTDGMNSEKGVAHSHLSARDESLSMLKGSTGNTPENVDVAMTHYDIDDRESTNLIRKPRGAQLMLNSSPIEDVSLASALNKFDVHSSGVTVMQGTVRGTLLRRLFGSQLISSLVEVLNENTRDVHKLEAATYFSFATSGHDPSSIIAGTRVDANTLRNAPRRLDVFNGMNFPELVKIFLGKANAWDQFFRQCEMEVLQRVSRCIQDSPQKESCTWTPNNEHLQKLTAILAESAGNRLSRRCKPRDRKNYQHQEQRHLGRRCEATDPDHPRWLRPESQEHERRREQRVADPAPARPVSPIPQLRKRRIGPVDYELSL